MYTKTIEILCKWSYGSVSGEIIIIFIILLRGWLLLNFLSILFVTLSVRVFMNYWMRISGV